jgi:hypothetical protein
LRFWHLENVDKVVAKHAFRPKFVQFQLGQTFTLPQHPLASRPKVGQSIHLDDLGQVPMTIAGTV